jgi:hypothetical protein
MYSLAQKCPYCGSVWLSSLDGEGLKKCLDCLKEFKVK